MIVVVQIEAGREEDREDEGGDDDDGAGGRREKTKMSEGGVEF